MRQIRSAGFRIGAWACAAAVCLAASCSGSRAADPASRFFAVHNVMLAIGLYQAGPVNQGTLAPGQEVRLPLTLPATCVAVVAMGSAGATELSLRLLDPEGNVVAEKVARESEAVIRACVERPGQYVAALRMAQGSGEYLVSSWTGGDGVTDGGGALASGGTCDAPTVLVPGHSYAGTTEDAPDEQEGTCASSGGHERVYRLDVPARERVTIDLAADFDAALYLRKGACNDQDAEVRCNDDEEPGQKEHSRIDLALDPGTYFVFVDGSGEGSGSYHIQATTREAPTLADICRAARPLATAAKVVGNLEGALDNVNATCGRDAKGVDAPFRFDVPTRARVRFTEKSSDFRPVVHVRRACEDAGAEVACSDTGFADDEATWAGVLDPGPYWVFADGADDASPGAFSLGAEMVQERGLGGGAAQGDGCGDAVPIHGSSGRIEGDTFAARDDVAVACASNGGADVIYRLDLAHKSRVTARLVGDESSHALSLERACADKTTEMSCGSIVDRTVDAGTYFLVVDGARPDSLGRFAFTYKVRDMAQVEATCAKVPALSFNQAASGSTAGAGDKFSSACGGRNVGQGSPDRVYRITVAKRTGVKVTLEPQGFRGVLSLRRVCSDDATEVKCAEASDDAGRAQINAVLEPGTYYAVVDGAGSRAEGSFSLRAERTR